MREISPKTKAIRKLVDGNPEITATEALPKLAKQGFTVKPVDFANVKSQYLKAQGKTPRAKATATKPKAKKPRTVKFTEPTPEDMSLAVALAVIVQHKNLAGARAYVAKVQAAIGVVEQAAKVVAEVA